MRILLDTHIFLWFVTNNSRLEGEIKEIISDSENEIYLSVISIWESMIKYQLGKLPLFESPEIYLPQQRELHQIVSLQISESDVAQLAKLPPIHRDPFDRMLISQALQNDLTVATVDTLIRSYPVSVI